MKYHIYQYSKKKQRTFYLTTGDDGTIYWGMFYCLAMLFDTEQEAREYWHSKDFKFKHTRSKMQGVEKHENT